MKGLNIFLGFFIIFLGACSSVKNKPNQEYKMMDNLTSRFNIVYHADKIIHENELSLQKTYQNDFNQYLPVLLEPNPAHQDGSTYLMDSVIGKANRIIDEKSDGRFVDHAYLLLGQANYLKGNFYNSAEYFNYLASNYAYKPKYHQLGRIFQARSLLQLARMTEAADALDSAFHYLETHKKTQGLAFATQADFYLKNRDLESAAAMLEQAMAQKGNRTDKSRWSYLLGQIFQDLGESEKAYYWFKKLSRNSDHELSFQAKLHSIRLESLTDTDPTETIQSLKKLARDGKNREFKDQIEYLIAGIHTDNGAFEDAFNHYEKSIRTSTNNRVQTSKSYAGLGDLHFKLQNFQEASIYYDSAAMVLPTQHANLDAFQKNLLNYQQLAQSRARIQHQDSLVYLAQLSEAERKSIVDRKIDEVYLKLAEANKQELRKRSKGSTLTNTFSSFSTFDTPQSVRSVGSGSTDNRFYFSNPDAIGLGMSAFRTKWGNRTLQDNWRFSTSSNEGGTATELTDIASLNTEENSGSDLENTSTLPDQETFAKGYWEELLSELPMDDTKMLALQESNQNELELVGNIYRFNLSLTKEAVETYEELIEKYPASVHAARWYYQLYQLHAQTNSSKSEEFQGIILENYPESVFAAVIKDPDFFKSSATRKQALTEAFTDIYILYESADYQGVQRGVDQLIAQLNPAQIEDNLSLVAQLAYLRALALGHEQPINQFVEHLKGISEKFPEEKLVTPLVIEHLAFIENNPDQFATREIALAKTESIGKQIYSDIALTPWPQLVLNSNYSIATTSALTPKTSIPTVAQNAGMREVGKSSQVGSSSGQLEQRNLGNANIKIDLADDSPIDRDLSILPEEAIYYFVVNVQHGTVNLAPSRFGIGQFNRSRFAQARINHQLKNIKQENQLIFIGPFSNFSDAKSYEIQILPLLKDIMKIPATAYDSFLATQETLNLLTDGETVFDYQEVYKRQR